jgi:hypothetical protein
VADIVFIDTAQSNDIPDILIIEPVPGVDAKTKFAAGTDGILDFG